MSGWRTTEFDENGNEVPRSRSGWKVTEVFDAEAHESNWLVTINTNRRVPESAQGKWEANMTDLVNEELNDDVWYRLIEFLDEDGDESKIDSFEVIWDVERGPKTGAMHWHFQIKIRHHTRLRLSYKNIRAWFHQRLSQRMDVEYAPHIHIKFISGDYPEEHTPAKKSPGAKQ